MAEEPEKAETFARDWEIRRRTKGETEWQTFAVFDPDTWWLEVKQTLEFLRTQSPSRDVEYEAFEILTTKVELKRRW